MLRSCDNFINFHYLDRRRKSSIYIYLKQIFPSSCIETISNLRENPFSSRSEKLETRKDLSFLDLARKSVSRLVATSLGSLATRLFKATARRRRWRQASGRESRPKVEKEAVVVVRCLLEPRNDGEKPDEEGYKEAREAWDESVEKSRRKSLEDKFFLRSPPDPSSNLLSNDSNHHFLPVFFSSRRSSCGNFIYSRVSLWRNSKFLSFELIVSYFSWTLYPQVSVFFEIEILGILL